MNDKLRELFEKSGLPKKEFCERIGIKEQRYYDIVRTGAFELKPKTFKKFKENYEKTI